MPATKRVTVYLGASLHRALLRESAATGESISELVNAAVRDGLAEDATDLAVFGERASERRLKFDAVVRGFKSPRAG